MQHLGEICTAWRSRGKSKQNKNHVKPRKEIQKRSFWRRFFSSFLSLLKEKRPPEAKRRTDSHASDVGHWLGMTPLRGVRGGQSRPPLRMSNEGAVVGWRGDAPQGYLFRFAPLRGHRPLRKVYRGWVRLIYKRKRRVGASFLHILLRIPLIATGSRAGRCRRRGRRWAGRR